MIEQVRANWTIIHLTKNLLDYDGNLTHFSIRVYNTPNRPTVENVSINVFDQLVTNE